MASQELPEARLRGGRAEGRHFPVFVHLLLEVRHGSRNRLFDERSEAALTDFAPLREPNLVVFPQPIDNLLRVLEKRSVNLLEVSDLEVMPPLPPVALERQVGVDPERNRGTEESRETSERQVVNEREVDLGVRLLEIPYDHGEAERCGHQDWECVPRIPPPPQDHGFEASGARARPPSSVRPRSRRSRRPGGESSSSRRA